jgi:hypothetical protein
MGVISADFRIEEAQANANVHAKPSPVGSATSGALPERGYEGVVVAKCGGRFENRIDRAT